MSAVLTPFETIAEVKAELLDLSANTIGRSQSDVESRCGELAEVLGNALDRMREAELTSGQVDYLIDADTMGG